MPLDPALPRPRTPLRDAIADAILRAGEADPTPELRALVAALETPADRLFTRYRGRPSRALRGGRWTDAVSGRRLVAPARNGRPEGSFGRGRPRRALAEPVDDAVDRRGRRLG